MPPAAEVERWVLTLPQVKAACDDIAGQVETEAAGLAFERAIDSGDYLHSIRRVVDFDRVGVTIAATDRKARWIESGTGIYGPQRRRITPKKGKYLVFRVRERGSSIRAGVSGRVSESGLIFARSVAGRPASHVMRDASKRVADRLGLKWTDHLGDGRGLG
jgi:hypothetical protein